MGAKSEAWEKETLEATAKHLVKVANYIFDNLDKDIKSDFLERIIYSLNHNHNNIVDVRFNYVERITPK